ncbi:acetyl-CoA carboxylase carboxyltransferase subunit alpha [Rubinisphaera brasiliensis]|uniref:Acetyl-coenzyme A carboxylase carboxyl transferase subunit alpha n=1 Tax=Rubinisphaera brasiliensis (strain ATCC 49424 / DSM 5305 / JCM 21570 / IAM 15109 / NBRC 103401 / IFAM 1448) TaxID=756272 RepID=F0SFK4_RUBBR|nr:acetyl-CoA carboxylase carboxyltransferase subunit alpha [Rubinisphaera brasiliensis]ADY60464.1 acetyl-CoA carboxylase carboxyltransferase subunit alpha [Rubinisphaera brasiliensis DSM 5305]
MAQRPLPFERNIHELEQHLETLEMQQQPSTETLEAIKNMRAEIVRLRREVFDNLDPWQIVQVARHEDRPQTLDYLELIFDEFLELHGDRAYGDDRAILTGFARIDGRKVLFVGQHKGRNLKERTTHNYGMAHPEGYRKAIQKMQMAAKFRLPIISFIDTAGAYPGVGAEERGQAYQIAYNLREMSRLGTPVVSAVLSEGGSGGAIGIGVSNYICMLQYAYYSVISPEGCAGILWKHVKHADKAARALRFTAKDLLEFGVIDKAISEPFGGAHRNPRQAANNLKIELIQALRQFSDMQPDELIAHRYDRFRRIGVFEETKISEAEDEATAAEAN